MIEFEADFAPYQPTKQKAVNGIETYQFSNKNDNVANNNVLGSPYGQIEGANVTIEKNKDKGHSIQDFLDKIKNLPVGKNKVINGEVISQ